MYVADPLGIFPHAVKSVAPTRFACQGHRLFMLLTRVFYMSTLFSAVEKWELAGLSKSEDSKSAVEAADPEGPGLVLGRGNTSVKKPMWYKLDDASV